MKSEVTTHEEFDDRLPNGTIIDGRYQIVGHLGRGGFAHVYRARHVHLEREVALKVLDKPQGPNAPQFQARFLQEARIAARIKHPNVVDVSDFGVPADLGQAYIAMELLEGHDLEAELVRHGPIQPARALRLFSECLEALAEGHRQGIVHKDLKPTNLFIRHPGTAAERLVILDFGIARVFGEGSANMTQTGGFAGTPAYLAPEYIEHQEVSPALDVYQMGLILIESLTASPAVTASNSMAYLMAHCQGQVVIPSALEGSPIGHVLRTATALNPRQRYYSAAELRVALLEVPPDSVPASAALRMAPGFGNRGRMDSVSPLAQTNVRDGDALGMLPLPMDGPQPSGGSQPTADETQRLKLALAALLFTITVGVVAIVALSMGGGGTEVLPTRAEVDRQPSGVATAPTTATQVVVVEDDPRPTIDDAGGADAVTEVTRAVEPVAEPVTPKTETPPREVVKTSKPVVKPEPVVSKTTTPKTPNPTDEGTKTTPPDPPEETRSRRAPTFAP